ncbi:MAG: hypothetical protein ABIG10_00845 [bacterium]
MTLEEKQTALFLFYRLLQFSLIIDDDNFWKTGVNLKHQPDLEEAATYFAENGGAAKFKECFGSILEPDTDLDRTLVEKVIDGLKKYRPYLQKQNKTG